MMDKNLITVAEYARIRGCSTAAVYKRLETTLKPYSKTVGKKTYLTKQVLIDEGLITVENDGSDSNKGYQPLNETVDNPIKPKEEIKDQAIIEAMKLLEKQLEAREQEIERLHQENDTLKQQLNDAAKHNQEHTDKLMELLAQANELNRNNQILLAQARKAEELPQEASQDKDDEQEENAAIEKKGFWQRVKDWFIS